MSTWRRYFDVSRTTITIIDGIVPKTALYEKYELLRVGLWI
jgi:hypothetical protein